jgi:glycine cleavage system H protein
MRPSNCRYSKTHEWARPEGDLVVTGITDFAVEELSDLVYIELPDVGSRVTKGERYGEIESVKAVSEVYAPVSGLVAEANEEATANLDLISQSPYEEGWIIKIAPDDPAQLDDLLSLEEYEDQLESEEH